MLTRLVVRLLSDDLNTMAYDAELAGLGWSASATTEGLLVTFYGWGLGRLVNPEPNLHPLADAVGEGPLVTFYGWGSH